MALHRAPADEQGQIRGGRSSPDSERGFGGVGGGARTTRRAKRNRTKLSVGGKAGPLGSQIWSRARKIAGAGRVCPGLQPSELAGPDGDAAPNRQCRRGTPVLPAATTY